MSYRYENKYYNRDYYDILEEEQEEIQEEQKEQEQAEKSLKNADLTAA